MQRKHRWPDVRREIWSIFLLIRGGDEEGNITSRVTSDEFEERVDS